MALRALHWSWALALPAWIFATECGARTVAYGGGAAEDASVGDAAEDASSSGGGSGVGSSGVGSGSGIGSSGVGSSSGGSGAGGDGGCTACAGACADEESDPANCGACGHSCLAGACVGGQCAPFVLAPAVDVAGLAVDATNVYFSESTVPAVRSCAIAGCGQRPATVNDQAGLYPQTLQIAGGQLYWDVYDFAGDGFIRTCALGSVDCLATDLYVGGPTGFGMVVDVHDVYWTVYESPTPSRGAVLACGRAGCGNAPTPLAAGLDSVWAVSVDAANVYFMTNPPEGATILRCPLAGCGVAPTALTTTSGPGAGLVNDGTKVYWTAQSTKTTWTLYSCAVGGCGGQATIVAYGDASSIPTGQGSLVRDPYAAALEWVSDGQLLQCPVTGCGASPKVLAREAGMNLAAADATSFYFSTYGTPGQVYRVAR